MSIAHLAIDSGYQKDVKILTINYADNRTRARWIQLNVAQLEISWVVLRPFVQNPELNCERHVLGYFSFEVLLMESQQKRSRLGITNFNMIIVMC